MPACAGTRGGPPPPRPGATPASAIASGLSAAGSGARKFNRHLALRLFFQPEFDHRASRRIRPHWYRGAIATSAATAFSAKHGFGLEDFQIVRWRGAFQSPEQVQIVHDPKCPALRRDDQFVVTLVKREIGDRHDGHVELDGLPVVAGIVRNINGEFCSGEKQTFAIGIFANDTGEMIISDPVDDFGPGLAVIGGFVEERPVIVRFIQRRRDPRCTGIVRRRVDRVDLRPFRQNVFGRRDVGPVLSAVAS
jgi:hypothetical protein